MIGWIIPAVIGVVIAIVCVVALVWPMPKGKFKCTTCGNWCDRLAYMHGNEHGCIEMLCWPCAERAGKTLPRDFWIAIKKAGKDE